MSSFQESPAPALRFANGDLLVKLSSDTLDDLLIHKDVVKHACPALAPVLRSPEDPDYIFRFDRSSYVNIPGHSQPTRLYTEALKVEEETLLLEGDEYVGVSQGGVPKAFDHSVLASDGWPTHHSDRSFTTSEDAELYVGRQYMVLFKILYGMPFQLTELNPWAHVTGITEVEDVEVHMDFVTELCARAEYLNCLLIVAKSVLSTLFAMPLFWSAIASNPYRYLLLAVKLRSHELYFDAIRHLVANPDKDQNYPRLAQHLGLTDVELLTLVTPIVTEQSNTIHELRADLRRLQLFKVKSARWYGGTDINYVNFFEKLKWEGEGQTDGQKANLDAEFYARQEWGMYLAQQEVGDRVFHFWKTRGVPAGPLSAAILQIEKRANSPQPSSLFGKGKAQFLAGRFNLGGNAVKQVDYHLHKIVRDAGEMIKNAFPVKEVQQDGKTVTYRRARHDTNVGYYTYLPWDESDYPWKDEQEWNVTAINHDYDITPATDQQLRAVGIAVPVPVQQNTTDEEEEEEEEEEAAEWDTAAPGGVESDGWAAKEMAGSKENENWAE